MPDRVAVPGDLLGHHRGGADGRFRHDRFGALRRQRVAAVPSGMITDPSRWGYLATPARMQITVKVSSQS
ncbi:MAG: hypothetical protein ACRD1K_05905 [Acidimicrobiales bacterium]